MTLAEYEAAHDGTFKQVTLVFLRRPGELLLAMKKRGFGAGHWNGVGGKLEAGETYEAAARREVTEEIGVEVGALTEAGMLRFYFERDPGFEMQNILCRVYVCEVWVGEPMETEEMAPRWFDERELPYDEMWADDRYWLPEVLVGKYIEAEFLFGGEGEVLDMRLRS
ncbi:MAG TPA: 8-oxo-dGTP diphosphatase [Candidatus Saccharimonadia bacterium]|nr:8-oxo-dGTP diphosphatase [Candidatus Saccharimonadia bacterium]